MFSVFLTNTNTPTSSVVINGSTVVAGGWNGIPLGTVGGTSGGEGFVKVGIVTGAAGTSTIAGTVTVASGTVTVGSGTVNIGGTANVDSRIHQYSGTAAFGTPTTASTLTTAGTIGTGEAGFIVNMSTVPVLVKYGTTASSTSFSYPLKGATSAYAGDGGFCWIPDQSGVVTWLPVAAGTAVVNFWKTS